MDFIVFFGKTMRFCVALLGGAIGAGEYMKGTVVVIEKPAKRIIVGQPVFVLMDSTGAR